MTQPEWRDLVAQFDEAAKDLGDAEELMAQLAAAILPPGGGAMAELTWPEPRSESARPSPGGLGDTEARLRAAEARFRTLIEQIPAVTFMAVLGEGKNEVYVSPHIEQMLGFTQAEWLADPFLWYWQLHPDDRSMWNEEFARGVRTGGPFRAECRFHARDGRVVWVHGEARLVKDGEGRPLFLQGVAFDITESKRAQEVLLREAVQSAKIEEELAIARRVQVSLVPTRFEVEGLEIAAAMEPASEVGGDYYDVLPFRGGAWLAVGDVSGHGLNAGLVMLMLQSATKALAGVAPGGSPRDIVCRLNEVLHDNIRSRLGRREHVTFTLFRYERNGRLIFAGAHEDILVWRRRTGTVEVVRPTGTWLGARHDVGPVTTDQELRLEDGDLLVLYTDGITEAMNHAGEQFNIERLLEAVRSRGSESPTVVRDHVVAAVHAWMDVQADDLSILVARHRA